MAGELAAKRDMLLLGAAGKGNFTFNTNTFQNNVGILCTKDFMDALASGFHRLQERGKAAFALPATSTGGGN